MHQPGKFHSLKVIERNTDGYLLEGNIQLHKQDAARQVTIGEELSVFLFHDRDEKLLATTRAPKGVAGDIVKLKVTDATGNGAFLDWGLPKDLFLPRSLQEGEALEKGDETVVKILVDDRTGRILATEKPEHLFNNETLSVKEMEQVELVVYKDTDLGFQVIINGRHLGLLHHNEIFRELEPGDKVSGFIKKIKTENRIDVMLGKPGHTRTEDEKEPLIRMLKEHDGFLPYHDKTPAEEIYKELGMSKKSFKMTIGNLYRQKKITIEPNGIRLVATDRRIKR